MPRLRVRHLALATLGALTLATAAQALPAEPIAGNPADRLVRLPIDDYRYDHAKRCRKQPSKGALALQRWLERNVRGSFWGINRCEKLHGDDYSLHAEGRALDWHLDVSDRRDRRAAKKLIRMLLATDKAGNRHALARRMGIQEIIWDCRSWWSGGEGMERYSLCYTRSGKRRKRVDKTQAHRDHIHLGLSRAGARMRTSFWRR
jgi:hypothetical protein